MLIVKKFGGTSVADKERIFHVAERCIRDYNEGHDVVVVLFRHGKIYGRADRKGEGDQSQPTEKRDGYAAYHRRTDVGISDVHGDGTDGCSGSILKRFSGTYDNHQRLWKCASEKN